MLRIDGPHASGQCGMKISRVPDGELHVSIKTEYRLIIMMLLYRYYIGINRETSNVEL